MSARRGGTGRGGGGGGPSGPARREGLREAGRGQPAAPPRAGAVERAARRAGLGTEELLGYLAALAGAQAYQPTDGKPTPATSLAPRRADLVRLLLACERLGLDPLAGEAYLAAPEHSPQAPAQVVLGLGGWVRLLSGHPQVCGVEFAEGPPREDGSGLPEWASCTIHRRDRPVATTAREYMDEARGATGAWLTHPRRMLRHCALVQCARVAIGEPAAQFSGEVDPRSPLEGPGQAPRARRQASPVRTGDLGRALADGGSGGRQADRGGPQSTPPLEARGTQPSGRARQLCPGT